MPKVITETDGDLDADVSSRTQAPARIPGDGGNLERTASASKEPLIEIEDEEETAQGGTEYEPDERLSASQRAPEDDKRERNRRWRTETKERRRQAIQRDKVELDFLRNRNEQLEKAVMAVGARQAQTEQRTISSDIGKTQSDLQIADETLAAAITAGNGGDVVKIQRIRDGLRDRLRDLTTAHQTVQREGQQVVQQQQNATPGPDPRVLSYAKQFFEDNKTWYDPQGRNEDSARVLRIDAQLVREGMDPRSDEYWAELEERAAEALPHRFKEADAGRGKDLDGDDDEDSAEPRERPAPRRGGPRMAGAAQGRTGTNGKKFKLNADRKAALVAAGVWDDDVLRDKYIRKYMAWDAENASQSRA